MEKQLEDAGEEELLKSLERLVESQAAGKEDPGSFLGFCARLLSVKPKADAGFKLALKRDLLVRHPAHLEEKADAASADGFGAIGRRWRGCVVTLIRKVLGINPIKRLAFGSVPVVAIVLAVIIAIGDPRVDTARAVEIMENDSQINAAIEAYGLRVRHVRTWKGLGYILLDRDPDFEDFEVTIVVDLERKTVWKIVAQEGQVLSKSEITGYLDDREAYWASKKRELAAEAEVQGMTFLEYITRLKKEGAAKFEEQAAAKGMTAEEYKIYLADEKAAGVEAHIAEFAAKAESMGMTAEEYKVYLVREKADKAGSDLADDTAYENQ